MLFLYFLFFILYTWQRPVLEMNKRLYIKKSKYWSRQNIMFELLIIYTQISL